MPEAMNAIIQIAAFGKVISVKLDLDTLPLQLELIENVSSLLRAVDRKIVLDATLDASSKMTSRKKIHYDLTNIGLLKQTSNKVHVEKERRGQSACTKLLGIQEVAEEALAAQGSTVAELIATAGEANDLKVEKHAESQMGPETAASSVAADSPVAVPEAKQGEMASSFFQKSEKDQISTSHIKADASLWTSLKLPSLKISSLRASKVWPHSAGESAAFTSLVSVPRQMSATADISAVDLR